MAISRWMYDKYLVQASSKKQHTHTPLVACDMVWSVMQKHYWNNAKNFLWKNLKRYLQNWDNLPNFYVICGKTPPGKVNKPSAPFGIWVPFLNTKNWRGVKESKEKDNPFLLLPGWGDSMLQYIDIILPCDTSLHLSEEIWFNDWLVYVTTAGICLEKLTPEQTLWTLVCMQIKQTLQTLCFISTNCKFERLW